MTILRVPTKTAVILTALPCEYRAARSFLEDVQEVTHPQGTVYEQGKFNHLGGRCWTVALVEIGPGNAGAAFEAERAAAFFAPDVMLFVGVAGGIKDVTLLDVVAATKVYGYESGKAGKSFLPRPEVGQSSYALIQRARAEAKKPNWHLRLKPHHNPSPRVYIGPIVAGEKVVSSTRAPVFGFIRRAYSDALAVEMEGSGFLRAAHANPNLRTLIVRGISDLIDNKAASDSSGYQDGAAEAASAFAYEVLANFEPEPAPERGRYHLVLSGTIRSEDRQKVQALVEHLREITGDARLTLVRAEDGSLKLVLEGTQEGYQRLASLWRSGVLSKMLGEEVVSLDWEPADLETSSSFEIATPFLPERGRVAAPFTVFLSHADADRQFASKLAHRLAEFGVQTWSPTTRIGVDWTQRSEALEKSDWFLFIISPSSVESRKAQHDLTEALKSGHYLDRILPLYYRTAMLTAPLLESISSLGVVDFRKNQREALMQLLQLWGLKQKG